MALKRAGAVRLRNDTHNIQKETEMSKKLWLIIDDGETFEGTISMFRNCFFDNADINNIKNWCDSNNFKLVITYK